MRSTDTPLPKVATLWDGKGEAAALQLIRPDTWITFISQRISLKILIFFAEFAACLRRAAAIFE
jgi:hypothetical protein